MELGVAGVKGELRIEHVAIERLKLDTRNPRIHSDRQIKQIARSIQAFGFNVPVLARPWKNAR